MLPILAFALVSLNLSIVAVGLILLSKWRVLAVKSRYWGINLRSNIVDIFIGLSIVEFMSQVSLFPRLAWFGFYVLWVAYIKARSNQTGMIVQGVLAQAITISALIYNDPTQSLGSLTLGIWLVAFFSARHILSAFNEDHAPALAHVWALFAIQISWVLAHWQIWFWVVPQIVLLLTILLSVLSAIYGLHKHERLSAAVLRQISASTGIVIIAIIILSDWQDKTI